MYRMQITFEGSKKVIADFNGHRIVTDQPVMAGGDDEAPNPYELFLASLGTCAGIFVKSFCDQRGIPTDKIYLTQDMQFNPSNGLLYAADIIIHVPAEFPEKYLPSLINVANLCKVKRNFEFPPHISVKTVVD